MTRDSASRPTGLRPAGAQGEARQSAAAKTAVRPNYSANPSNEELVERLRAAKPDCNRHANAGLCHEAADTIEELLTRLSQSTAPEAAGAREMDLIAKLVREYKPTMDAEVLHSWACDAAIALERALQSRPTLAPFACNDCGRKGWYEPGALIPEQPTSGEKRSHGK